MLASHTREIERMDDPSQSIERIWTRLDVGSLFMPIIYELICVASSLGLTFDEGKIRSVGIVKLYFNLALSTDLTYMSIGDLIRWRRNEGALVPLRPRAKGAVTRRALFLTEQLAELLATTHDDEMEERLGHLQADLELFVTGLPIGPKYLFLLYPLMDAVWEIRSVRHEPSIRVLGLFAQRDVFVATHYAMREDLGGWQSREWKTVKRAARARWRQLFHDYQPLITSDPRVVVSDAIDGKYFKGS